MIRYIRTANSRALAGTALLRLDFNTEDNWRMEAAVPTIKFLLRTASRVVIVSHRGRPEGKDLKFSLKKDARNLSRLLKKKIIFVPRFEPASIKKAIEKAPRGSVILLENLRFMKGEEENDPELAKKLASFVDFYVNDAFAVSHRANASVVAITKFLPSYAGLIMEKEIESLSRVVKNPVRPLVFILGGGKAADKLDIIQYFNKRADYFLLGGAAANTIEKFRGMDVRDSLVDTNPKSLRELKKVVDYDNIVLPNDNVFYKDAIVDFGPETVKNFSEKIKIAKMIIWSGPLGLIEKKQFTKGTLAVAKAVAANRKAFSLAGGGETVMFLKRAKLDKKFSFISTGGGAMIDFLAGKTLPGIKALQNGK